MSYRYHMVMARRQTLVQLTDEMVVLLDALALKKGTTRSALIRSVLDEYLREEDEAEKDRRLIEGYKRIPPGTPDDWGSLEEWGDWAIREAIKEEPWDDAG
jgi:hypothetical protein